MSRQFLRKCVLSMSGSSDASIPGGGENDLRIEASIGASSILSPNPSKFRITNPNAQTVAAFKNKDFKTIQWEGGYDDNCAFIYSGDVKQSLYARSENIVDSYIDIHAYENGNAYQMSHVNKALAAGWAPRDKLKLALDAMAPHGVKGLGRVNVDLDSPKRPRGRAIVGMARDIIREVALSAGGLPCMDRGQLHIVDHGKPLDSDGPITLNSKTGLIGFAQQTEGGVVARCLINPAIKMHTQVNIDESSVIEAVRDNHPITGGPSETNRNLDNAGQIAADGLYRVTYLEIDADTRGQSWYMILTCLAVTAGAQPNNSQILHGFN